MKLSKLEKPLTLILLAATVLGIAGTFCVNAYRLGEVEDTVKQINQTGPEPLRTHIATSEAVAKDLNAHISSGAIHLTEDRLKVIVGETFRPLEKAITEVRTHQADQDQSLARIERTVQSLAATRMSRASSPPPPTDGTIAIVKGND